MKFFNYKEKKQGKDDRPFPVHIAIIMDGNGRWAKKRGLPRTAGHVAGADTLVKIARYAFDIGVKVLTVYAFSTENWSRPKEEVDNLMKLAMDRLPKMEGLMEDREVCVRFLGDVEKFSPPLLKLLRNEEERTAKFYDTGNFLNICANYGSRDELSYAFKSMTSDIKAGKLNEQDINPQTISSYLYTSHCPDPDLIIRPSGELRLSNFLMYQAAYSEFYYDDVLWPDYKPENLDEAIESYMKRDRRFGNV